MTETAVAREENGAALSGAFVEVLGCGVLPERVPGAVDAHNDEHQQQQAGHDQDLLSRVHATVLTLRLSVIEILTPAPRNRRYLASLC